MYMKVRKTNVALNYPEECQTEKKWSYEAVVVGKICKQLSTDRH
jgi:hypothetical protein